MANTKCCCVHEHNAKYFCVHILKFFRVNEYVAQVYKHPYGNNE